VEYRGYKVVYRRYASLFFVVAVDGDEEVSVYAVADLPFFISYESQTSSINLTISNIF
jgi:hypothetical protein